MTKTEKRATKGMFAALGAASVSILRTATPQELFQGLCDAAVRGTGFKAACIAALVGDDVIKYVAFAGRDIMPDPADIPELNIAPGSKDRNGLVAEAFLTGLPVVCND